MRHILFPSDASKCSRQAFKQLVILAKTLKAHVTLLHDYSLLNVTRPEALDACDFSPETLQDIESRLKAKGLLDLQTLGQELETAAIPYDLVQGRGHAGKLVVDTAVRRGVDLIVMGNRGLNALDSFLMGSTSTYVLHNSLCPVMVIPCDEHNV